MKSIRDAEEWLYELVKTCYILYSNNSSLMESF